jgi:hypothetical protein
VLTSDGTTWTSQAATGGQYQTELFTAPGTWTKPASCTQVRVTVVGGGGGGGPTPNAIPGGVGGVAIAANVPVSGPVAITVGAGGASNSTGGTSSFGSALSATGGTGAPGSPGSGTVSSGTTIRTSNILNFGLASSPTITATYLSIGMLSGLSRQNYPGPQPAFPYSNSRIFMAGAQGAGANGGAPMGGIGGAVVVEYVG